MSDVNISKYRAQVIRQGSTPASPGFAVAEGQNPVDPSGSGQTHLPVTIATASTGLSITESQILSGAGLVSQYIRGDGSLADFPESSGGGSSVSYYLNGSVAQGTIGGVAYKEMNKVPILGAGTDFTINANGYIASFITDAGDPNLLEIPGGNWNFETYFSASSGGGSPSFYVELYKVNSGGTATLIASNSTFPELIAFGTNIISYFSTLAVPTTALALTDRLAIRYYVTHSGRTITLHTEDNHLCQIVTTFTTGLTALNGLTAQIQNFAVGTSGTDFAIASATATHTFNLPTASATNRGALSSADWTTFNNKTSNLGTVTSVGLSSATSGVTIGSTPVTTSGTITLAIATASGSQNGLLSSTDWTTFNSKQNALTNPVTGTGASGQVAYWSSSSAITGESNLFWDGTNDKLGIGTASPSNTLTIKNNNPATSGIDFQSFASLSVQGKIVFDQGDDTFNFTNTSAFAAGGIVFKTNSTTKFQIFTDGNVLIQSGGTFTNNGARLQVSGTATISGIVTGNANEAFRLDPSSGASYMNFRIGGTSYSLIGVAGTTSDIITGSALGDLNIRATNNQKILFSTNNGGSAAMAINSSANLGIGTVSPVSNDGTSRTLQLGNRLVVQNVIGTQFLLGTNCYYDGTWKYIAAAKAQAVRGTGESGTIQFSISPTGTAGGTITNMDGSDVKMVIHDNGNVLIGTVTNGASKLRIVGLPTSAAGLSSGDIYNLSGVLMIA